MNLILNAQIMSQKYEQIILDLHAQIATHRIRIAQLESKIEELMAPTEKAVANHG